MQRLPGEMCNLRKELNFLHIKGWINKLAASQVGCTWKSVVVPKFCAAPEMPPANVAAKVLCHK